MQQFSSLGRPLDLKYRTNLLILILAVLAGVIGSGADMMADADFTTALQTGFFAGATTMATWVLSREIDHDNPWSAFLGVGFAWVWLVIYSVPVVDVIALFALVGLLRMVNRIVGPPATWLDSMTLLVGIALIALLDNWIVAVVAVIAFLLDGLLVNPIRRHIVFAALGVAIIVVRLFLLEIPAVNGLSNGHLIGLALISIAYLLTVLATRDVNVGTDAEGYVLDIRRIRAAMVLALVAALLPAIWNGDQGVIWMLPLWCALLSTAIYRAPETVREWMIFRQRSS